MEHNMSAPCVPQHKGKLTAELSGPSGEVFAKALRGLSGARLTRPGQFRSADDTPAVRCSYKVRPPCSAACEHVLLSVLWLVTLCLLQLMAAQVCACLKQ